MEFYNSLIRNDKSQFGYILESGQIDLKFVNEMIDRKNITVVCLGLGDLSIGDMVEQCVKYDIEDSWTYGLSKSYIKEHAKDWYERNKMLKRECPKYNIKYFDTSRNRNTIFQEIIDYIENELNAESM